MDRDEILRILSTYDLTEDEELYLCEQLYFTDQLNSKGNEKIQEFHKQQKENRDSILGEIAKVMLSYNIINSFMSIGDSDRLKLQSKINGLVNNKIQSEVNIETLKAGQLLKYIGETKYNTNNYINNLNPEKVKADKLDEIINKKVDEKLWSDRLWNNKNQTAADLRQEIKKFLNGETTVNQIEDIIKNKYDSNAFNTKRLVVDNIARVQEGINDVWREDHNIKRVLYLATLCHNTCGNCSQYDGKEYLADRKPVDLPQHNFCRCTYVNLPYEGWRPSERLDNETKKRVSWKDYEEWYGNNRHPFVMDLQAFGVDNWRLLQEKIEKGIINNDQFNMCYSEFNKIFQDGVQTPLENIKCAEHTFVHIAQRHPYMVDLNEIRNIKKTLINPNSIYETQDKNGFKARGYIRKIGEEILLIISRGDIISAYYPNDRYLKNNIIDGGNLLWENK